MEQLFGVNWDIPSYRGGVFDARGEASDDESVLANDRSAPNLRKDALRRFEERFGPAPYLYPPSLTAQGAPQGADGAQPAHADLVDLADVDANVDDPTVRAQDATRARVEARAAAEAKQEAAAAGPARTCKGCGERFVFTTQRKCSGGMCERCNAARVKLSRLVGPEASDPTLRNTYGVGSDRPRAYGATFRKRVAQRFAERPGIYDSKEWVENGRHPKRQLELLLGESVEAFLEACPYR